MTYKSGVTTLQELQTMQLSGSMQILTDNAAVNSLTMLIEDAMNSIMERRGHLLGGCFSWPGSKFVLPLIIRFRHFNVAPISHLLSTTLISYEYP